MSPRLFCLFLMCLTSAAFAETPEETRFMIRPAAEQRRFEDGNSQLIPSLNADGTRADGYGRVAGILPETLAALADMRDTCMMWVEDAGDDAFSISQVKIYTKAVEKDEILQYVFAQRVHENVPDGDIRKIRGGYIHPIRGLHGETLTEDAPKDHFHHHGLFWHFPHVVVDGRHYDFWEKNDVQIRFKKVLYRREGPVVAVLGVENEWILQKPGETLSEQDANILTERVWITVFREAGGQRAVDVEIFWTPKRDIELRGAEGKSYGGMTLRFSGIPAQDGVVRHGPVMAEGTQKAIPAGEIRFKDGKPFPADLPNCRLAWVDYARQFPGGKERSGAALFVPETHPDYPPYWLVRVYGAQCVGYAGVQGKKFPAGQTFGGQYRVWIHADEKSVEEVAEAYRVYNEECGKRSEE